MKIKPLKPGEDLSKSTRGQLVTFLKDYIKRPALELVAILAELTLRRIKNENQHT